MEAVISETKTMEAVSVLIVENYGIIREGFRELLEKMNGVEVAATASSAEEALEWLEIGTPDVVLMDIGLPGINGVEATGIIKKRWPSVNVLALTNYDDRGFIEKIIKEGASGYVLKDCECDELLRAIKSTARGERFFSNGVSNILLRSILPRKIDARLESGVELDPEELTRREKDVLRMICREKTNKEIGDQLCIGTRTVDSHRRNLLQKIGARNTAGLVIYAVKHGLYKDE